MQINFRRRHNGSWGTASTVPPTRGLVIAGTRPELKNFTGLNVNETGMNTEVPHRFPNGTGRQLLLTFDNWGVPNTTTGGVTFPSVFDNACPNPVTYRCSLSETDGSAFYQGKFCRIRHADGTTTELLNLPTEVTVPGGDSADAVVTLPAVRPAGTWLTEHAYVYVTSGQRFFRHQAMVSGGRNEVCTATVGETDKSMQMAVGTKPASGQDGSWSSSIRHIDPPLSVLRHPTIITGDSLTAGNYGWIQYLFQDTVPHAHLGRGTETFTSAIAGDSRYQYRRRLGALGGFTRAVIQYGTNDLVNPRTLTNMQSYRASMLTLVQGWASLPIASVMLGTLPPTAKSTDGWTTSTNQSLNFAANQRGAREQVRQDYNTDLRQGTAYGAVTPTARLNTGGYYVTDCGGSVETFSTSAVSTDVPLTIGTWKVSGSSPSTTDGLHPGTQTGRDAWAAAIPDNFFAA